MDAGLIVLQTILAACVGWGGFLACAGMRNTRDLFTDDEGTTDV